MFQNTKCCPRSYTKENQICPVSCVMKGLCFWFSHSGKKDDEKCRVINDMQGTADDSAALGKHH